MANQKQITEAVEVALKNAIQFLKNTTDTQRLIEKYGGGAEKALMHMAME